MYPVGQRKWLPSDREEE